MIKAGDRFKAKDRRILDGNSDALDFNTIFTLVNDGYYWKLRFIRKDRRYGENHPDSFGFQKDDEETLLRLFRKIDDAPILNGNDYYS